MVLTEHDNGLNVYQEGENSREIDFTFFQTNKGFLSTFDIALFTMRMNSIYGEDIELQTCQKMFIDAQFKLTRNVITFIVNGYFLFFVIPFVV